MKLTLIHRDDAAVEVSVQGTISTGSLGPVPDPLGSLLSPEAYRRRIVFDLSAAEVLDSSGIGWLLACHKRLRQAGGKLVLRRPQPLVAGVLKLMNLDRLLEIEPPLAVNQLPPARGDAP